MLRIKVTAKVLAPLLVLALISLCVYSYFESEHHLPYPTTDEVRSNYQVYVGKQVSISGTVVSAAENVGVVSSGGLNFTVGPLLSNVGDKVEVLGTLGENYRVTAEKSVVYGKLSYYSIFPRSLIGAILLAFFFLISWKFDLKKFRFAERK